jgi:hypothetical protein
MTVYCEFRRQMAEPEEQRSENQKIRVSDF